MKVVVLAGGISTERDVSLISGKMIYQAMKRLGHQAVLLDVFLGMERDDIDHIFESDEESATPAQTLSAARWRWISALQKNCLCKTGFRPQQASA